MRLCVALLFLFVTCSVGARAGADVLPTVAEIEAKNIVALGGPVTNARETIVSTGTLGPTTTVGYVVGKDTRKIFDRNGLHYESGTNQGEDWHQGFNGLTVIEEPDPGTTAGAAAETAAGVVTHVTVPFDAYVITKFNSRRAGTRTFYDSTTFRIGRTETVDATGTEIETVDEWGTFGTRTRAKRWTHTSKEEHLEQHFERTEFADGVATADDIDEPQTRRHLVQFPAGVTDVALPVQFIETSIMVRVSVGTRSFDLMLDTGAAGIEIDTDLARQLGLTLTNATSEYTAQRYTGYQATIPELKIGTLTMRNLVVDTGPTFETNPDGARPRGLLGFDFLAQLGVSIDYDKHTVHVAPAAAYVPPSPQTAYGFTIRLGTEQPTISVNVSGAHADRIVLDTGFGGELSFFDYFARRYPHVFAVKIGEGQVYGVGGAIPVQLFRFPSVTFGALHFVDFEAMQIPGSSFVWEADGLIGSQLLKNFNVGLDYTNGRAFFTLNENGKTNRK